MQRERLRSLIKLVLCAIALLSLSGIAAMSSDACDSESIVAAQISRQLKRNHPGVTGFDVKVNWVVDGWLSGTTDDAFVGRDHIVAHYEKGYWKLIKEAHSCSTSLVARMPHKIAARLLAEGWLYPDFDALHAAIARDYRISPRDLRSDSANITVAWILDGWSYGSAGKQDGGCMYLARKVRGHWKILEWFQDSFPLSYAKHRRMPKRVADRLVNEGVLYRENKDSG